MAKNTNAAKKKPARDTNGKFAKKPENPDCEPATKGYVKCIARTVLRHDHVQRAAPIFTFAGSVMIALYSIVMYNSQLIPLSLLGFAIVVDFWFFTDSTKTAYGAMDNFKAIQKYEPPKCESPKRDCEE